MLSFSIVIPTLREAARIGPLLHALQAQDYNGPHEIIVCDGKSEDGTADIARGFEGVRVLEAPRGVSRQRNAGARAASGETLVFMDADCLPSPQFLSRVAASYRRLPFAVACPWFVARDAGFGARTAYFGFNVLFWLGQGWLRTGSGVCIIARRDVWGKCGGFPEELHLGEDIAFLRRASRHGLHRHLMVPLETSGRRFKREGMGRLMLFYARISPLVLLGLWQPLQKLEYHAAPDEGERVAE